MAKDRSFERQQRFQELLIEARKEAGLTQSQLAKMLGKPQPFVSRYESGERRVDVIELCEIAEAVGRTATHFVKKLED